MTIWLYVSCISNSIIKERAPVYTFKANSAIMCFKRGSTTLAGADLTLHSSVDIGMNMYMPAEISTINPSQQVPIEFIWDLDYWFRLKD